MSETQTSLSKDAAQLALGGGLVFVGSLLDKAFRLLIGLFLVRVFSVEDFGTYNYVIKTMTIVAVAAPMGQDISMVFFGARFRRSKEYSKLKGTFLLGVLLTICNTAVLTVASILAIRAGWLGQPEHQPYLFTLVPIVAVMPLVLFMVSCLRSFKDMRGNVLAFQLVLPGSLLLGQLIGVGVLGGNVYTALQVFIVAHVLTLVVATVRAWKHYGPLMRDRSIAPTFAPVQQLTYAIPQGIMGLVYRLNVWMDVMMLGWLANDREVGLYSVAVSLALLGVLPTISLNTMFNPVISELVQARDLVRLNQLLKLVTRWLLILSLPFFLFLLLLPDFALLIYGEQYTESMRSLQLLALGQMVIAIFAPAMRIIPMSGYALLNLCNGIAALALAITLNWLLIPQYGGLGAAAGTALTLAAWSAWRLAEVHHLFRCSPFSSKTVLIGGFTAVLVGASLWLTQGSSVWLRLAAYAAFVVVYVLFVWRFGRSPDDHLVTERIRKRIRRLIKR